MKNHLLLVASSEQHGALSAPQTPSPFLTLPLSKAS